MDTIQVSTVMYYVLRHGKLFMGHAALHTQPRSMRVSMRAVVRDWSDWQYSSLLREAPIQVREKAIEYLNNYRHAA